MYKQKIIKDLNNAIKKSGFLKPDKFNIAKPKDSRFGDYSTNIALILAKKNKKNPLEIAKKITANLKSKNYSLKVAKPGFINFYFNNAIYFDLLEEILHQKDQFGSSILGKKQRVMIEYSQPNVNKFLHIGHARNDFLGMALANILAFCGYKIIRANYYNDRGIAIAKTMLMYKKYYYGDTPERTGLKPDVFVGEIYAEYEKEIADDPKIKEEVEDYLIRYEAGDKDIMRLWKKITFWAYKGFNATYKREGSHFDINFYESAIYHQGKNVVQKYLAKGIFKKASDGHIFIDLTRFGLDKKVLIRSDGTAIYITSDLVLAEEKEKLGIDKSIYVVDIYQSYHFKVLFKIFEILGYKWANKCHHLGYGYVFLGEKKMSSRKGNTIATDELLDDLKDKIKKIMRKVKKKKVTLTMQTEKVAESLALGAAKYAMLRYEEQKDIRFVPDQTIKLEGETGPYLQYTFARIQGILAKIPNVKFQISNEIQNIKLQNIKMNQAEKELLKNLMYFTEVIEKVATNYKPHFLCNYLYNLAQSYNSFYNCSPVLKADEETAKFRLALCEATGQVLQNGLRLLGISTPDKI